ncbi:bifunctional phosphopantothenoylcysteine decarboxylase/phosphopantothenate--cysteine ligase CoaBC [Gangjinia marincola]|uniref:Coenzyme A biosynthesis bifunctional protein CoaBC n=1 Tax=Gangjinia marincola TaxID=578463 RepID=A0ABN1MET5_9FLAO
MAILADKKILLGVTGGIAAYKSALLVRQFIKAGAQVKVVMTEAAKEFVTPLTLSTLSKNEVISSFTHDEDENAVWNNHVELGLWADYMVIAPVTANTMSKMVSGAADNILLATYLSAKCPVYFAPAMDLDMYQHPSTKNSIAKLQEFGNTFIPATSGELASGLEGQGRMAEPVDIVSFVENHILTGLALHGKTCLITAGPTYEPIDPVRFIGNHSSGKMGFEIAKAMVNQGAKVILVSGPSHETIDSKYVERIDVMSAAQMFDTVKKRFASCDIAIAAAAVADYTPVHVADQKIKKKKENLVLELKKTTDILKYMGDHKKSQFVVGFALETQNELANAKEKLARKNADFMVLNSLNDKGAGFKKETNKITIIHNNGDLNEFELKSKSAVANDIVHQIIQRTA